MPLASIVGWVQIGVLPVGKCDLMYQCSSLIGRQPFIDHPAASIASSHAPVIVVMSVTLKVRSGGSVSWKGESKMPDIRSVCIRFAIVT